MGRKKTKGRQKRKNKLYQTKRGKREREGGTKEVVKGNPGASPKRES